MTGLGWLAVAAAVAEVAGVCWVCFLRERLSSKSEQKQAAPDQK